MNFFVCFEILLCALVLCESFYPTRVFVMDLRLAQPAHWAAQARSGKRAGAGAHYRQSNLEDSVHIATQAS